jgi:iron complex outermembrane receptor protein
MRGNGRDIDSDLGLGEDDDADIFSAGLTLNIPVGSLTFTSLTGYKKHDYVYAEDFDGTPLNINDYAQDQEGEYFEQELRLVSGDEGPFSWYVGASYYDENIDVLFSQHGNEDLMCNFYLNYYGFTNCSDYFAYYGYVFTPSPDDLLEQNRVRGRYHGWAAYIDTTYKFSEALDIGVGLRYSDDTKNFGIWALPVSSQLGPYFALGFTSTDFLTDKQSWDAFTPRFITRYRPNDDWMIFASATRGFKSGGFGSFTIAESALTFCGPFDTSCLNLMPGDATPNTFEPEKAWSYEIGAKGGFGGVKLDANVYYYTYKDLQVIIPGVGGGILVDNVGQVKGWGVEGSATAPLGPNFDLMLAGAWADSEVTEAQALCDGTLACEGQPQPSVPKFSGSAVLRFHAPLGPGELNASAEIFGQTDTYGGLLQLPEAVNDGYAELALRLGWRANAGWSVTGYVENLTNVLYYTGVAEGGDILPAHYFGPARPRTFGVRLTYDFGG